MNRRVQDFHHIAQGFTLRARRSFWAVAELEQEFPVWGLDISCCNCAERAAKALVLASAARLAYASASSILCVA